MWDLRFANPFGRLSVRNILMFALVTLVTCLGYIFATAPQAHAAPAKWQNDAIVYDDKTYTSVVNNDEVAEAINQPDGTTVYAYLTDASTDPDNTTRQAFIIYFAPGVSPPEATSAKHQVFNFTPPNSYKSTGEPTDITIEPSTVTSDRSSCSNENLSGIGWVVCPVTNFLAGAMDILFSLLSGFLEVRPVQTTTENALYRAWSFMRNFANVAFVIAFLIIIYSQITSIGVSNYGIKKLLPRLIIAAILVNVSYWICAIAIDISNILGYSVQDLFIQIRNNLVGAEGNSWDVISWKSISSIILAGGAGATALGVGAAITFTGAGAGAIYLLLPILLGVITAILVALLVLAARQAIITVLVILAPLAFVAFLLPNTEKYFGKWRELFMTMLLIFPIFSVIFGGSQLAGVAIIQNADTIIMIILGMAVQVAPVVVTPILIKFSGSLLGRIANMVNNPNRGLIDRTRKFANERKDQYEAQRLAKLRKDQLERKRAGRNPSAYSRVALLRDNNRRKREGWKTANDSYSDGAWANSQDSHDIHAASQTAGLLKERGEAAAQAHFETLKHTDSYVQSLDHEVRVNKLNLDVSKAKVEANWEELKAGNTDNIVQPDDLAGNGLKAYMSERKTLAYNIQASMLSERVEQRRNQEAKETQNSQYASELLENAAMRTRAGGINKHGADSVLANAIAQERKSYSDNVTEKLQLVKHFNLSSTQRQTLAMGKDVVGERISDDGSVTRFTFSGDDDYSREAAIEEQMATGSFGQIQEIIEKSSKEVYMRDKNTGKILRNADGSIKTEEGATYKYRTTISSAIPKNGIPNKAIYFGSKAIDDTSQGTFHIEDAAVYNIVNGKVKDDVLASMDASAITKMFSTELREFVDAKDSATFERNRQGMINSAYRVLENPTIARSLSDSARAALIRIRNANKRTDTN